MLYILGDVTVSSCCIYWGDVMLANIIYSGDVRLAHVIYIRVM